jgi:hypothetical protein
MDFEVQYMPIIEKFLDSMYPGIKLTRTADIYGDPYMPYDYESQLLPDSKRRVFVEFKSVNNPQWSYLDGNEFVDLMSISEGDALL